ncbi:Xaa-Pro aminopeptidase [soil metagenome]
MNTNFKSISQTYAGRIPQPEYNERRNKFARQLAPESLAIIVSNPERIRSNDTDYNYRQSSNLLYLTGFPEPESALVVTNFGGQYQSILFVLPKNKERETWTGIREGVFGAKANYAVDRAYPVDQFAVVTAKLLQKARQVYYKFDRNQFFDIQFTKLWQKVQKPLFNPETIVHEMRLIKSESELTVLRQAAFISAQAHCAAALRLGEPELMEFQLQATIENVFTEYGAQAPAYNSIVAAGNNACVLHYTTNRDRIKPKDLVLIDAACELDGYATDITRTFPASGKFSRAQSEIYQLVLNAQLAAIRIIKPGKTLHQIHSAASKVLRLGLVELGILPVEMNSRRNSLRLYRAAKKAGTGDQLLRLESLFMHGTSHYMGLDVHDVGMTAEKGGGKDRTLEPGMVFTIEPGLYINAVDTRVLAKYRGIGVRIEDDVLVTADGCEVLTSGVPKSIAEIETLISSAPLVN